MTEYNAEDFAKATFARHPEGDGDEATLAMRTETYGSYEWAGRPQPWETTSASFSDSQMVDLGWVPVQESPLTDDAIKALVAKREQLLASKIREEFSRNPFSSSLRLAAAVYQGLTEKPRPEGAVELETVIGCNAGKWTDGPEDVRALADLLAENGVRVVGEQS